MKEDKPKPKPTPPVIPNLKPAPPAPRPVDAKTDETCDACHRPSTTIMKVCHLCGHSAPVKSNA